MSESLNLTESQLWFAERKPVGFLVALWLDPETAAKLALPGGESADSLHITLCYCGDAAEMGELGQARAIAAIDNAIRYWNPLEGTVAGYGRFIATESSDNLDVFYATPDVPNLSEIRQRIADCLIECGVPYSSAHGYSPHITLAYVDSSAKNPVDQLDPLPLKFGGVTVMVGARRIDVPFYPMGPETAISMSEESSDVPLTAPLGAISARPLLFSFEQTWIPFLPIPGTYSHSLHGTLDLTTEKYAHILQNFKDNVYGQDLPINAEHDSIASGAIGWIRDMRLASDGSIEVKPEWNDRGVALIEGDRFRYVSAEFCWRWQDPVSGVWHQDVAVGLAICTRPHFKTDVLKPLAASERAAVALAQSHPSGETGKGITMTEEELAAKKLADEQAAKAATEMPVVLADLQTVVITAEQRAQERRDHHLLTEKLTLTQQELVALKEKYAASERDRRKERFTAEVLGRSPENGTAWFGPIQDNVTHLLSLAESHGDESTEVRWAIAQKRNEAKAIQASGLFDPISASASEDVSTVNAQVTRFAEQYRMADPALTQEQAISKAYSEHPDLYVKSLSR